MIGSRINSFKIMALILKMSLVHPPPQDLCGLSLVNNRNGKCNRQSLALPPEQSIEFRSALNVDLPLKIFEVNYNQSLSCRF